MNRMLIENYIRRIKKEDIYNFALSNDIKLNEKDLDILYHYLRNFWEEILYGDRGFVFKQIEKEFEHDKYLKIYSLFDKYFQLYQNFL